MARPKKRAVNKTAFVLGLPKSLSGADVVKTAASKGIKLSVAHVYAIRSKANAAKKAPGAKRGPGRPRKVASGGISGGGRSGAGLEAAIESLVRQMVDERIEAALRQKLSALT